MSSFMLDPLAFTSMVNTPLTEVKPGTRSVGDAIVLSALEVKYAVHSGGFLLISAEYLFFSILTDSFGAHMGG